MKILLGVMMKDIDIETAIWEHFINERAGTFLPDTKEIKEIAKFIRLIESKKLLEKEGEIKFWTQEYYRAERELSATEDMLRDKVINDGTKPYKYIALDFSVEKNMNMEKLIGQSVWDRVKNKIGRRITVYFKVWDINIKE